MALIVKLKHHYYKTGFLTMKLISRRRSNCHRTFQFRLG